MFKAKLYDEVTKYLIEKESDLDFNLGLQEVILNNEIEDIGECSDGFHTFNQLYHQRAMLFACIVRQNSERAWKTHRHEDGELCFGGGWFLVTIDTPKGAYGYHYENKYWNLFDCKTLDKAKHWDGYTEEDVTRLLSLADECAEGVE